MSFATSSIISNSESNPFIPFPGTVPTEPPPPLDAILVPDTPTPVEAILVPDTPTSVEAIVNESPHQTKKGIAKDGWVFSYAEEIKLRIDDNARKELSDTYGYKTLGDWAGKKWRRIPKSMSMYDVMRINSKAGKEKEIIEINSKFLERIPADKDSCDRLRELENLSKISIDLGFGRPYLSMLGTEKQQTITKERADKVNNYIKEKNIGNGLEIFDYEGMIQLAKEEYPELAIEATPPVNDTVIDAPTSVEAVIESPLETKKGKGKDGWVFSYAEEIKFRIDNNIRKKLSNTYGLSTIANWVGKKRGYTIPKGMSMYAAMRINWKAGKEIIKINSQFLKQIPVDQDCRDRLGQLSNLTKISTDLGFGPTYLIQLGTESCRTISKERADKVNKYIKKKNIRKGSEIFDLEGMIRLGEEEHPEIATKKLSEEHSTRKSKRSLRSSDATTVSDDEDCVEPNSKRQRITDDKTGEGHTPPSERSSDATTVSDDEDCVEPNSKRRRITDDKTSEGHIPPSDAFMAAEGFVSFSMGVSQRIEPTFPLAGVSPFVPEQMTAEECAVQLCSLAFNCINGENSLPPH